MEIYPNLQKAAKAVVRGKFIEINAYPQEMRKISVQSRFTP